MRRSTLGLVASSLLAACATAYTPDPGRPFEPIKSEFKSSHRVTLRNAQPATEEVTSGPWIINYHAWTDVAITIANRELTNRGMTVADGAGKTLDLAIESAITESGFVKVTSTIVMRATTGDGYSATYTGLNSSAVMANAKRQVDGAMMRVVVELLNDPKIVEYLTK